MAAGTAGYSAEDLAELGLRSGLFGDLLPTQLGGMEFLADPTDPLVELQASLPEAAYQAAARLLVVEHLIGGGRASRINRILIGPARGGGRHIELIYTEPRRYSNVEPGERRLVGQR